MTEDQLFNALDKESTVNVVLATPPTSNQEEMRFLYENKLMPWEEYHDSARALAGLAQREPPAEPPPPTAPEEQIVEPLGPPSS